MKQGLHQSRGYTIVEVLIVLAVTSALLLSVMLIISRQQGRTEFSQAINDIQAQINDVMNNVATGYYTNIGSFSCTNVGGVPTLSTTASSQGTNKDCVFLGQAMQFKVDGNESAFNVYNLIGLRQVSSGVEATTLTEANIKPMVGNGVDTTDSRTLLYNLKAVTMYAVNGSSVPIGTMAFTSTLGSYSGCNSLCSSSQTAELRSVQPSSLGQTKAQGLAGISAATLIPAQTGSVTVCFESGSSNQKGTITIGGNGRQVSTKLDITSGNCT